MPGPAPAVGPTTGPAGLKEGLWGAGGPRDTVGAGSGAPGARAARERDGPLLDPTRVSFGEARPGERRETPRRRRPGGAGRRRDAGGGDPRSDKEVELTAVEIAREFGRRELEAEVTDVQRYKLGWDLEFVLPGGRRQLVEVKGSAGQGPIILTRNEIRAARGHDNWVLLYVTNLVRGSEHRIIRFSRLGGEVTDDALEPVAWEVWWEAMTHDVIEVTSD